MAPFVRFIFLTLTLLISVNSWATNVPGVNNVWQFGGSEDSTAQALTIPFSDNGVIALACVGAATGGNFHRCQQVGAASNAAYQVPAGKNFYAIGMYWTNTVAAYISFFTATASFTNATGTTPTGIVYYNADNGGTAANIRSGGLFLPVNTSIEKWLPMLGITFGATSFIGILPDVSANMTIRMLGYLK